MAHARTYLLNARWMVSAALLEASGPPYFLCSSWSCFSAKSALSGYRSISAAAAAATKVAKEEEAETVRGHVRHSDVHSAAVALGTILFHFFTSSSSASSPSSSLEAAALTTAELIDCCQNRGGGGGGR